MKPHHPDSLLEEANTQNKGVATSYICRQSTSTRWTPTSDQIRILKELYYNHGVRSPDSDQIQRISSRLRQYGKIEGKNVFYWFQNHKARERQKKRSISDHNNAHSIQLKPDHPTKYPNLNGFCGSPLRSFVCGSMEKGFKDCSISSVEKGGGGKGSFTWAAVDPYSYNVFSGSGKSRSRIPVGEVEMEEDEEEEGEIMETLPLFPVHSEDHLSGVSSSSSSSCIPRSPESSCCCHNHSSSRASLELTLSSFSST